MTKRKLFEDFNYLFITDMSSGFNKVINLAQGVHVSIAYSDENDFISFQTTKSSNRYEGDIPVMQYFESQFYVSEGSHIDDIRQAGVDFIGAIHGQGAMPPDWVGRKWQIEA